MEISIQQVSEHTARVTLDQEARTALGNKDFEMLRRCGQVVSNEAAQKLKKQVQEKLGIKDTGHNNSHH